MVNSFPYRKFFRINIAISLLFSAFVSCILFVIDYDPKDTLYRFLQGVLFMGLLTFGNLGLAELFYDKQNVKYKKAKFLFYTLSYLSAFFAFAFSALCHNLLVGEQWEGHKGGPYTGYIIASIAISLFNTFVLIVHQLILSQYNNAQSVIEKLQLKANISEAKNLLLRQQIEPHFLFNTLTTLKSLYKKDAMLGEEYLVNLANFLRSSLSNSSEHIALINDELSFCELYLKMQKIRFGTAIEYSINVDEQSKNSKYLPYFSVQTLVENALKHNDFTEANPIKIEITNDDKYILIKNNLKETNLKEISSGHGLYNIKERYQILGLSNVKILKSETEFSVYLTMIMP